MSEDNATGPDFVSADIGIVHATAMEMAPFFARCDRVRKYLGGNLTFRGGLLGDIRVALVQCGLGPEKARRATQALIDGHDPKWIISAGFSGALTPDLKVGDIVVGTSIVGTEGREVAIDLKMPASPQTGLYVGRLVMTDQLVRTIADKKSLAEKYQALAVDMESRAVADVCKSVKARFLAIRAVSDDLAADLPAEVLTMVGDTGSVRLGAALGALWKRPGSWKEMWRLRDQGTLAADKLAKFLDGVIVQLHAAG